MLEAGDVDDKYRFTGFDKLGLANVQEDSNRM